MLTERTLVSFSIFESLTDPRMERTKRHQLFDIVILTLCATLGGANSYADVERFGKAKLAWFLRHLELPNGIPSHDTIGRVFARLNPAELINCLDRWLRSLGESLDGKTVSIDGKTLRGSLDAAAEKSGLHLVSAWASEARLVLGQVAVAAKSNEITAIPLLLDLLELTDAVVTIDAMGCQKAIAAKIRDKGADYVLALKGNQEKIHEATRDAFEAELISGGRRLKRFTTKETNRGRVETREYSVMPVPDDLVGKEEWRDLRSLVMVVRVRTIQGRETGEVHFYLTSLAAKPKIIARHIRGHWGIENTLHWTLDVTFTEDKSRIRKGHGPQIAAIFRRWVLSILQQDTSCNENIRGKRLLAGWNDAILESILVGFKAK